MRPDGGKLKGWNVVCGGYEGASEGPQKHAAARRIREFSKSRARGDQQATRGGMATVSGGHKSTPGSAGIGMYGLQPSAPADFIRRGFAARTNSRALDGLLVRF